MIGPWLQMPTTRSVTVMWETAEEVAGRWSGSRPRRSTPGWRAPPARGPRPAARPARPPPDASTGPGRPFSFCATSETGGYGGDDLNRRLFAQIERWRPDLLLVVVPPVPRQPRGKRRLALPLHRLPGARELLRLRLRQRPLQSPRLDPPRGLRRRRAAADAGAGAVVAAAAVPAPRPGGRRRRRVAHRLLPLPALRLARLRGPAPARPGPWGTASSTSCPTPTRSSTSAATPCAGAAWTRMGGSSIS